MNKSRFLIAAAFLLFNLLPTELLYGQETGSSQKPNIILIFADDLGIMDLGYTGSDYYETPNLDKLASEGMQFTNAYASAANCAPSRGGLLSGQYNPRHGIFAVGNTAKGPKDLMRLVPVSNTTDLAPSFVTIAEAMKTAGYATGQFGKWHVGSENSNTGPEDQGFDVSMDTEGYNSKEKISHDPKGVFEITAATEKFITNNKNRPFFAFVSQHAVHGPHHARKETLAKFEAKKPGKHNDNALYAACIYDFDASVGRLLQHLKSLGLDKNTLVVFTSDNGGAPVSSQEPYRGNKGSFYEGGIRDAFIAKWPGHIKAGSVNASPVINIDLYPTFLAAGNGVVPTGTKLDGENLMPLFMGAKKATDRDKIFWHFPGYLQNGPVIRGRNSTWRTQPITVMRKGDFKILLYHEEWLLDGGWEKRATNNSIEIYDLKNDVGEYNNLVASNPTKRDELLKDVLTWIEATDAPMARVKGTTEETVGKASKKKKG